MKKIVPILLLSMLMVSCGMFKKTPKTVVPINPLTNGVDSMSYSLGMNIGEKLAKDLETIPGGKANKDMLIKGFSASLKGDSTLMTSDNAMSFFNEYLQKAQKRENERIKKEGKYFLESNKLKEGVVETESGLQYFVLKMTDGDKPIATDKVKVHYTGRLIDGTVFDSSVERGTPAEFPLNNVIKGWTEGVQLMSVGSKYKFFIPYDLAYGSQGAGKAIPPYATLIFEVELLEIIK